MASTLVTMGSLAMILVILASVLGAVERRESFLFVTGMTLFVVAHLRGLLPETVGVLLALVGILAVLASTAPLLREPV